MSKKWENYEEYFLRKHLTEDPKEVHLLFSEQYGLTRSLESVRKKMVRLREDVIDNQDTVEDLELEEDSYITSPLQLLDPSIVKQQASLWLREISKIQSPIPRNNNHIYSNNKSLVIVISDVHWGKQTDSFNMNTASQRILSIVDCLASQELPLFDEIVVVLLGDLVEGEGIFETQSNLIEAPVIMAHKEATECIYTLLLSLSATFQVPVRVECAPGNHGRVSKSAHPASNWDSAIAQSLSMIIRYSNNTDIIFNLNLKEFNIVNIKSCRTLLNHRALKHISTPAMQVKFAGHILSKDIDLLIGGHWHCRGLDTFLGRTYIKNGSVCGPDDLGEKIGREDPASQVYFFIDPKQPGFVSNFNYVQW